MPHPGVFALDYDGQEQVFSKRKLLFGGWAHSLGPSNSLCPSPMCWASAATLIAVPADPGASTPSVAEADPEVPVQPSPPAVAPVSVAVAVVAAEGPEGAPAVGSVEPTTPEGPGHAFADCPVFSMHTLQNDYKTMMWIDRNVCTHTTYTRICIHIWPAYIFTNN